MKGKKKVVFLGLLLLICVSAPKIYTVVLDYRQAAERKKRSEKLAKEYTVLAEAHFTEDEKNDVNVIPIQEGASDQQKSWFNEVLKSYFPYDRKAPIHYVYKVHEEGMADVTWNLYVDKEKKQFFSKKSSEEGIYEESFSEGNYRLINHRNKSYVEKKDKKADFKKVFFASPIGTPISRDSLTPILQAILKNEITKFDESKDTLAITCQISEQDNPDLAGELVASIDKKTRLIKSLVIKKPDGQVVYSVQAETIDSDSPSTVTIAIPPEYKKVQLEKLFSEEKR